MVFSGFGSGNYGLPVLGLTCGIDHGAPQGTWTLVTILGVLLREAESTYGPRVKDWTILGIEFGPDIGTMTAPQIWYPGSTKNVAIRLSLNAAKNPTAAIFELAHETIHLLAPSGRAPACRLEEGLATDFSRKVLDRHGRADLAENLILGAYKAAEEDVRDFLHKHPNEIKRLRAIDPTIDNWTPEFMCGHISGLSYDQAAALCVRFVRDVTVAAA
jgi:hypothetical protein